MLRVSGIFPVCSSRPFLMTPNAPITTRTVSVLIPYILFTSISRSLYFEHFSMTFTEVFRSDGTAISISLHGMVLWSLITMSGLLAAISQCVCIWGWWHLQFLLMFLGCGHTIFLIFWYYSSSTPSNVCMQLLCSGYGMYSVWASLGQPDTMWSTVSSYLLHILHMGLVLSLIILAWYNQICLNLIHQMYVLSYTI